ncbi:hypothetical protein DFJ74DRAFT_652819 [Hyaloraphidium curvatum]|nr:hypothetical protein DFJ74DRAFT_652819 [Hyaloraphidium curvatum]
MAATSRGTALAAFMAFSYSSLSAALKLHLSGGPDRTPLMAMLWRYGASTALCALYAVRKGIPLVPADLRKEMAVRAAICATSSASFSFSLVYMDIGAATVLNYTSAIWSGPFGMLIGEQWEGREMAAAVVCVVGIAFLSLASPPPAGVSSRESSSYAFGLFLGLLGAAATALQAVHLRKVNRGRTMPPDPAQVLFSGFGGMLALTLVLCAGEWWSGGAPSQDLRALDYLLFLWIIASGLAGQLCAALAVEHLTAARLLLVGTLQVVFSFAAQVAMGRMPGGSEMLGAACVVGGVIGGSWKPAGTGEVDREAKKDARIELG